MWVTIISNPKGAEQKKVKINTEHIVLLDQEESMVMLSSNHIIYLSEDSYQDLDGKMFPTRKRVAKDDTEIADYLNQLHKLLGNSGTVALTGDRRAGIAKLLKEGFTKEQIIIAATNIGKSDWMRGKNDNNVNYAKVDYLFRKGKDRVTWNINKWQEAREKKKNRLF